MLKRLSLNHKHSLNASVSITLKLKTMDQHILTQKYDLEQSISPPHPAWYQLLQPILLEVASAGRHHIHPGEGLPPGHGA